MNPICALLDLIYPPRCPFCDRILERGEDGMCALCGRDLPWTDGPGPAPEGCEACLSPLHYRGGARGAVHRYKFRGGAAHAGLFGDLMARSLSECRDAAADLVTWTPLHPERKKRRGYDQAELLARRVAELLARRVAELRGIPAVSVLEKIRRTGTQSQQNTQADRRANVEGAYRAIPGLDLTGKRVLLVDDVVTTGATLAQCAACLRAAGAAAVVALTFARAEARRSGQRGSLERSEGERRAAQRPADQPESEQKRPSALTASQRDNTEAQRSGLQKG